MKPEHEIVFLEELVIWWILISVMINAVCENKRYVLLAFKLLDYIR
jgi:hypothetical protein